MMNVEDERPPAGVGTEAFVKKWMPHALTQHEKSEFLMDLERLVLTRTMEIDRHSRRATTGSDGFDWSDDGAIAVKRVCALAVYRTGDGHIAIRQEGSDGGEDTVVVIPLDVADSVMEAIQRQFREPVFLPALSRHPER
ncbi:MAG TPA: hypothetical protein VFB75_24790 [Burkholderiales bacterium]|nr:hypothetical protein [Burkholderiales bacterium]